MDQKELQAEMLKVVKSKEAKEVFEEGLKNLDPKAFTKEGIIQSYEIDYDSIKHSPMGGIMVNLIVNHDPQLKVYCTLNKVDGKTLEDEGGGHSSKLYELLKNKGRE